jgi:hypothetical protein
MATHATVSAWASPEGQGKEGNKDTSGIWTTIEGVKFNMRTLSGRMSLWEYEYKKKSIGLDGKARGEYVDVSKLEAIGPAEDSMLAQSILNEGNKQLATKDKGRK